MIPRTSFTLLIAGGVFCWTAATPTVRADEVATQLDSASDVHFANDVVPIFTKRGCNSGGCHGKSTGRGGFKLSLFGFEPDQDFDAITHGSRGRRLFPAAPDESLLLKKATMTVPHGGGRRLEHQ